MSSKIIASIVATGVVSKEQEKDIISLLEAAIRLVNHKNITVIIHPIEETKP